MSLDPRSSGLTGIVLASTNKGNPYLLVRKMNQETYVEIVAPFHPVLDSSTTPPGRGPRPASPADARPDDRLATVADVGAIVAIVLAGAIFGFFYAWVCSTMWGLDAADPRVAIEAMQAMNASVRNAVFFPAFFLTPVALALAGWLLHRTGRRDAARWFLAAAMVYLAGGLTLTMAVNVPMNERLADIAVPVSRAEAETIWSDYSGRWQVWNAVRTVSSGGSLVLAAIGLRRSARHRASRPKQAASARRSPITPITPITPIDPVANRPPRRAPRAGRRSNRGHHRRGRSCRPPGP